MNTSSSAPPYLSRRGFIALAGAAAVTASLAGCAVGGNGAAGSSSLKFWDMPWGTANYAADAAKFVAAYKPANGLQPVSYQQIQWSSFSETFASAIASKTGPAVSTGGGFQAFQYAQQGAIAYADNLVETLKKDGVYSDFLPNTLDAMKTANGYVAIPWALDVQTLWYRKSILDEVGAQVPSTWAEVLDVGKKVAAKGYHAFGISGGSGNYGPMAVLSLMINNGGGLFTDKGVLDVVTERNIETVEFVMAMVKAGLMDPGAVSLTDDALVTQWSNKKVGMGFYSAGLDALVGDTKDILVANPLTGPHGDVGGLYYVNNIMMYANTPSQPASEAFVEYFIKNMKTLWEQNLVSQLPALRSITQIPQFKASASNRLIVEKWQPICKTTAAQSATLSASLASIDGGQAMSNFCQTVLAANTPAKTALSTLQSSIQSVLS